MRKFLLVGGKILLQGDTKCTLCESWGPIRLSSIPSSVSRQVQGLGWVACVVLPLMLFSMQCSQKCLLPPLGLGLKWGHAYKSLSRSRQILAEQMSDPGLCLTSAGSGTSVLLRCLVSLSKLGCWAVLLCSHILWGHSHEISKDLYVHTFVVLSNYDMDFQLHGRNWGTHCWNSP